MVAWSFTWPPSSCWLLPNLSVLLLVFLEPVSHHHLPGSHGLAWLLYREDFHMWPKEDEKKGRLLGMAGEQARAAWLGLEWVLACWRWG